MKTPALAAIAELGPRWSKRYSITGGTIGIATKWGKYKMIKPVMRNAPKI